MFDDYDRWCEMYTTSVVEKDNLVKTGWKDEGIAWYGVK